MFVTETERAFARLLDALHVSWKYEPDEFVLDRKADGSIKTAFRPDFYLPDLNLYVEVTAAKSLTTKNRKIRVLHEQFPETRIALICFSDLGNKREHLRMLLYEGEENLPALPS
jgi:hypothetical protein